MAHSDPLVPFGIAIIIIVGGCILIPYFRGKADLLTQWNVLLFGLINFTALGAIEVHYVPTFPWEHLKWFQPSAKEVQWFMVATSAFIATLLASYYLNAPAKRFAQRRLRNWPEVTPAVTFFVLGFCFIVAVAAIVCRRSAFLGPLTFNLAWVGAPAGCVFCFALWNRNRLNMGWLALFIGVFMCSAVYAMVMSAGRRLLLSLFLGPIVCLYWSQIRYWRPTRAIAALAVGAFMVLTASLVYSQFRHTTNRSAANVVQKLKQVRERGDWFDLLMKDKLEYFAQSCGANSLLTQRFVAQGDLAAVPLNTLRFLAAYPIPRKLWQNKPNILGVIITRDVAGIRTTNWGVGVAGHGAYEGGIAALMLYAVLLAFFIRILDEPMRLQTDNPFLMYIQASSFPHVMAIPRGDMGGMFVPVAQSVLFAVILGFACRMIFGARRRSVSATANTATYGSNRVLRTRTNP